jgi:hypothetical protein
MPDIVMVGEVYQHSKRSIERAELEEFDAMHAAWLETPINNVRQRSEDRLTRHTMELVANLGLATVQGLSLANKRHVVESAAKTTLTAMGIEQLGVFTGELKPDPWRPAWPGIVRDELNFLEACELFMPQVFKPTKRLVFYSQNSNLLRGFEASVLRACTPGGSYGSYAFAAATAKGELQVNEERLFATG